MDLKDSDIPSTFYHGGTDYEIVPILKEAPEEFYNNENGELAMGDTDQVIKWFVSILLPIISISAFLFWGYTEKIIIIYSIFISIMIIEYYLYKFFYDKETEGKVEYPHIKVSDKKGVITTVSPKSYVKRYSFLVEVTPLFSLPLCIYTGRFEWMFDDDMFVKSLESGLAARKKKNP